MVQTPESHLKDIGLDAAREVMGEGRAEEVEVSAGVDWTDLPAYFFEFLMEQGGDRQRAALLRIRLGQKIRDKLLDRGDGGYPFIRILDREDWGKRPGA